MKIKGGLVDVRLAKTTSLFSGPSRSLVGLNNPVEKSPVYFYEI